MALGTNMVGYAQDLSETKPKRMEFMIASRSALSSITYDANKEAITALSYAASNVYRMGVFGSESEIKTESDLVQEINQAVETAILNKRSLSFEVLQKMTQKAISEVEEDELILFIVDPDNITTTTAHPQAGTVSCLYVLDHVYLMAEFTNKFGEIPKTIFTMAQNKLKNRFKWLGENLSVTFS